MPNCKIRVNTGDVFYFKVRDNVYCYGQVIASSSKMDSLYILFDFTSDKLVNINEVITKPILAIGFLFDFAIQNGEWKVIGKSHVATKILVPNFLMGMEPTMVVDYSGQVIRAATDKDLSSLQYFSSFDTYVFELLARREFLREDVEWWPEYNEIIYDPTKWQFDVGNKIGPIAEGQRSKTVCSQSSCCNNVDLVNNIWEVAIEFPIETGTFGLVNDLDKRYYIEALLNERLASEGIGKCGTAEIGSEMIIYCYVTNDKRAVECINNLLAEYNLLGRTNVRVQIVS